MRPGEYAVFYCFPGVHTNKIMWYINDTEVTTADNIVMDYEDIAEGVGILNITNTSPNFATMEVQCAAEMSGRSDRAILTFFPGLLGV